MARLVPIEAPSAVKRKMRLVSLDDPYEAYAGPGMGGFGVLPQSATEGLVPAPATGLSASPFAGMIPQQAQPQLLAPPDAPIALPPPPPPPPPRMVNQTAVPKGFTPRQLNEQQAAAFDLYDRAIQVQNARSREAGSGRGMWGNIGVSAQKRMANNILGLPSLVADAATYPQRALGNVVTQGELPNFSGAFPQIGVDEIASGIRGGEALLQGQDPVEAYRRARGNIDMAESARESARPYSTMAGNVLGDIGTIVAGRVPVAGAVVGATKSPKVLHATREAIERLPRGTSRHLKRFWNSEPAAGVKRALGKAGETGFEGATLAMLNKGDPVETGAYAAGGQLVGSFALGAIKHPYYSMGTIAASAILWQMLKDAIPGGRDRILESVEHATKVATIGTVLGGAAGLLGAGRYRGSSGLLPSSPNKIPIYGHGFAEDLSEFAEGANAALRTTPNSLIEQFVNDEKSKAPVIGVVMDKLTENPRVFTSAELRRLTRVIRKNGDLRSEIEAMLKNEGFAARMGM